jgi:hypothetical protein
MLLMLNVATWNEVFGELPIGRQGPSNTGVLLFNTNAKALLGRYMLISMTYLF